MGKKAKPSKKTLTETDLKRRLSKQFTKGQIEELIDDYVAASIEELPDMGAIIKLAQKTREARVLNVRYTLESEEYDALAEYFGEDERPGTYLVKRAVGEFIQRIIS